jgi:hypothetical protein
LVPVFTKQICIKDICCVEGRISGRLYKKENPSVITMQEVSSIIQMPKLQTSYSCSNIYLESQVEVGKACGEKWNTMALEVGISPLL